MYKNIGLAKKIAICAMLTAIGVLLQGPLAVPGFSLGVYTVNIGLVVLPAILAGVMFGPAYGGLVSALMDLLQALLFPVGAFNPIFTLSATLFGLIPGLFFMKPREEPPFLRVLLAVFCGQVISSVLVNSTVIAVLYGVPWPSLAVVRGVNQAIMIPIYSALTYYLLKLFGRYKVIK